MKFAAALGDIVAFETFALQTKGKVDERAKLLPGVTTKQLDEMVEAMGGLDRVEALAKAMPAKPELKDVIGAFGDGKKLGAFIKGTLGGNAAAFAALADKGCGRDPVKLADLATAFSGDPETLSAVLDAGGLGGHPEALAEIFATACGGTPGNLKNFCKTFNDAPKRENLRAALDEGGLGQSPAALGSLAKGDNGVLLLAVGKEADKGALRDLVQAGGMGGHPPDHPDTLKSVLVTALGSDPKRLKELRDAFPVKDGEMPELATMMRAMNGKSKDGSAKAGERLKKTMDAFKRRTPALTNAQLAQKLHDPFWKQADKRAATRRAADESGSTGLQGGTALIVAKTDPPMSQLAGPMLGALGDGGIGLLDELTTIPKDKADLAAARDGLGKVASLKSGLALDVGDRAADPTLSEATQKALDEADKLRTALEKKPDGGTPAELAALAAAAEACWQAAAGEPGAALRKQAGEAAEKAMKAVDAALKAQAAKKLGALAGADAQKSALGRAGDLSARLEKDGTATNAEKAAARALADAGAAGLRATALASLVSDMPGTAGKVAAAIASELNKPVNDPAVVNELAARKKAAEQAAKAAQALEKALKAASAPVDPALIAEAARAAEAAAIAAPRTADQAAMNAALAAAKTLSDLVAKRTKETVAEAELARAVLAPEAADALEASAEIGGLVAALDRDVADGVVGADAAKALQKTAQERAQRGAVAAAELARTKALGDPALEKAAKEAAARQAALDGKPVAEAEEAANEAARLAGAAATAAAANLTGKAAPVDPTLIEAALKAAEDAARAAGGASDKVRRDLALTEGAKAAKAAAAALALNARKEIADRAGLKADSYKTEMNNAAADARAYPLPGTLLQKFNKTFAEMGEAATAKLNEIGSGDGNVKAARLEAAKAAAKAQRPGASGLDQVRALEKDAAAQGVLAALARTRARQAVTALTDVGPSRWPPPGPPFVNVAKPPAPTADQLRAGSILCEAAITASTLHLEALRKLCDAARDAKTRAEKVPPAQRSPEEVTDLNAINLIWNNGADNGGAPQLRLGAEQALTGIAATTDELKRKSKALMKMTQISRADFVDPTDKMRPPTTVAPADQELETASGFATLTGTKSFKTVQMQGSPPSTTPPSTRDSLLSTGATLEKKLLPGFATPNAPVAGHNDCRANLEHMCSRHCREHFTFDPDELADETSVLASAFADTWTGGIKVENGDDPMDDVISQDDETVRDFGTGKTTTLWPEGVTAAHIQTAVATVIGLMKGLKPGNRATFYDWVRASPGRELTRTFNGVPVGTETLKVTLGVNAKNNLGIVKAVMFYPENEERLTVRDCHLEKGALAI